MHRHPRQLPSNRRSWLRDAAGAVPEGAARVRLRVPEGGASKSWALDDLAGSPDRLPQALTDELADWLRDHAGGRRVRLEWLDGTGDSMRGGSSNRWLPDDSPEAPSMATTPTDRPPAQVVDATPPGTSRDLPGAGAMRRADPTAPPSPHTFPNILGALATEAAERGDMTSMVFLGLLREGVMREQVLTGALHEAHRLNAQTTAQLLTANGAYADTLRELRTGSDDMSATLFKLAIEGQREAAQGDARATVAELRATLGGTGEASEADDILKILQEGREWMKLRAMARAAGPVAGPAAGPSPELGAALFAAFQGDPSKLAAYVPTAPPAEKASLKAAAAALTALLEGA